MAADNGTAGTGAMQHAGRRAFALVSTWPETKNAEFEVIERLVAAATNIGADVFVINDDGYVLSTNGARTEMVGRRITAKTCDFVISLHFESPRLYDVYSYVTLWNPPDFYHDFGYRRSTEKLVSHSDVLSCDADIVDMHAANLFEGAGRAPAQPFPTLFHSLPEPYLEPTIGADSKLFYIGINWERISGQRGRHQELLERLDEADLVSIYGPEEFYGVKPWEGFRNYRGSIPFDGRSVLAELNKAGICLALSSKAHQTSGIMSNRLFEGLAGGAVLVANPHSFIDKHFADCVYVIDDKLSPDEMARAVRSLVEDIRRDPTEALARARRGQERLRERFSLEVSLRALFDGHAARVGAGAAIGGTAVPRIAVLLLAAGETADDLAEMVENVRRQHGVEIDLVVVGGDEQPDLAERLRGQAEGLGSVRVVSLAGLGERRPSAPRTRGALVAAALGSIDAEFLCLMDRGEHWFADHLASMAAALRRAPDCAYAVSGKILEDVVEGGRHRRRLAGLGFAATPAIVAGLHPGDAGRFLFRADIAARLPSGLLPLLDGCEPHALRLWANLAGPLARTNHASFVERLPGMDDPAPFPVPEEQQREYLLDSVRGRTDWIEQHQALVEGRPLPQAGTGRIEIGRMYYPRADRDGSLFLRSGFSATEAHFTWVDGPFARLEFELPSHDRNYELQLVAGGRNRFGTGEPQHMDVVVNDRLLVEAAEVPEGGTEIRVPLRSSLSSRPVRMRVTLRLRHAEPVRDATGKVVDPRYLGMQLSAFGVFHDTTPAASYDTLHEFRDGGSGVPFLRRGFSHPEAHFVWVIGRSAELVFAVPNGNDDIAAKLVVSGPAEQETGEAQRLTIRAGETVLASEIAAPAGLTGLEFAIPRASVPASGILRLTLQTRHAERPRDERGEVADPRELSLQLASLDIRPMPSAD